MKGCIDLLSVLIADDNKDFDISIINAIGKEKLNHIKIQGIATNGLETYQKIKTLSPDVVLLDVQMPIMNGFDVIHKLLKEDITLPKILLVSAFPDLINTFPETKLISGILFKPFDFTVLNNYLLQFCNENDDSILNKQITQILGNFDFNINSLGYSYLVECIKLCIKNPLYLNNLEKDLYTHIAKMYRISNPSKIKWAIEKSINSMFRYTKTDILNKFFPNISKLSPKFFIKEIINMLNQK